MAILITGGAGFIGSHTCVELLDAGYELVVVDNFSNSNPGVLKRIREISGKEFVFYGADLNRTGQLEEVFLTHPIEAVIHFAGLKAVGESVREPLHYYKNNVSGTLNLLALMEKHGVKSLVFSSSATVYGNPECVPISEKSRLHAANPYGRTKLMVERILQDVHAADREWSIALLRYFNPIGAHPSGLIGEDPNGAAPANLMPYISRVAAGKLDELEVFGNDYPTADGTGIRDYIHIVDLARGHLKALEKVFTSTGVEAYNLGTGTGCSVLELVASFEKASGVRIPYRFVDRRPGDAAICYADPSKAQSELGWSAARGIDEMCRDGWKWQTLNPNGYRTE
ncbi:UDP-glucose 4-epimerase GalE [Neobacillus piezotolerans]|uniref:UDP-glucose 4-epimerase n=1 Tax=Neobacillus piezotolerans TaxID=2259171 RepID=A0A3D8GRY4_9BACI|nr:UDP-glucose 4-epimerase GalE [Neobacillus piezotolerans]RDU37021.1 UDP-glucose 4-epimerase GalE [Neobacillus piezotolerans]